MDIVHNIQSAVAPVFMLTAVATMISALATRLARIIDRARSIEARTDSDAADHWELRRLALRGKMVNLSIGFLVLCALFIGMTVAGLFLNEYLGDMLLASCFLFGISCFAISLILFLVETLLAKHTLSFSKIKRSFEPK